MVSVRGLAASLRVAALAGFCTCAGWHGPAQAAQVDYLEIDQVAGSWGNATSRHGAVGGQGGNAISWGRSANAEGRQSGYRFDAAPLPVLSSGRFVIGSFTHDNAAIWSNSATLTSARLTLSIAGHVAGEAFSIAPAFTFSHNETLNNAPVCAAGGPPPCADLVTITDGLDYATSFTVADMIFRLVIEGFVNALDGSPSSTFLTAEGRANTAYLVGRLEAVPVDVPLPAPLPAAGWMLLAGVGLLGAMRRRQQTARRARR